jgi:4-hydroxy-2-oxoheptanedioate aldolase
MKSLKEQLTSGAPQLGLCIMYPSPGVVERIGGEWDWVWIDGQHGELGYDDILGLVRACDLVGTPAMVRVPGHEAGPIGKVLDTGAAGVIVPCVDTPEQAQAIVKAAKFPPLGNRSYGGRRPIDLHGRAFSATANDDTLLVVQIESPEAVKNADAIASVPGVDALFLGPDDIMLRRGYAMDQPRSRETLMPDMEAVATACQRHGKYATMVGFNAEMLQLCLELRYNLIAAGGDVAFLANSSRQAVDTARAHLREFASGQAATAPAEGGSTSSPY